MMNAIDLARYIVDKCIDDGVPISNFKLQAILFYIQKYFILQNERAFYNNFEAWEWGSVISKVYYYYCHFGVMDIDIDLKYPTLNNGETIEICSEDKQVINNIIEHKRSLEVRDMFEDIKREGGAWDRVYNKGKGNREIIPIEYIKRYG